MKKVTKLLPFFLLSCIAVANELDGSNANIKQTV